MAEDKISDGGRSAVGAILREPILHFLFVGAVLVLLIGDGADDAAEDRLTGGRVPVSSVIRVTGADVAQMLTQWTKGHLRPPTTEEVDGLIEDFVRDEVFYREATAMGLDRGDVIVRRRMRQKLQFVTEDLATFDDPTDAQLQAFLAEYPDRYTVGDRYTFIHVLVKYTPDAEAVLAQARAVLAQLRSLPKTADPLLLGDRTMLPRAFHRQLARDVAAQLGPAFVRGLHGLESGSWGGPVESSFGLHLVRIDERVPGRMPALADIREVVERDWRVQERENTAEAFYRELRSRYTVLVDDRNAQPKGPEAEAK